MQEKSLYLILARRLRSGAREPSGALATRPSAIRPAGPLFPLEQLPDDLWREVDYPASVWLAYCGGWRKEANLLGSTALITGAAHRLGRATALTLARAGVDVAIHYGRSAAAAAELAEEIRSLGRRSVHLGADLSRPEEAAPLVERALDALGSLEILINNASIFPENTLRGLSVADIQQNVQINAVAPLFLARAFAERGGRGSVINLLDCRIADYDARHAAYHLSKRMLYSLTKMMALEFAPRIRVNGVAPGLILPPPGEDEAYLARLAHTNPLQMYGDAGDITSAIRYLLESRFVTGQVLYVDGGRHLKGCVYG